MANIRQQLIDLITPRHRAVAIGHSRRNRDQHARPRAKHGAIHAAAENHARRRHP